MKELDKTMYFRAKPGTLETARILDEIMNELDSVIDKIETIVQERI